MEHLIEFIGNHWALCAGLLVVLVMIVSTEIRGQQGKAAGVSPQIAVDLMNNQDAQILDLRDVEVFKQGHIINAVQASLTDLTPEKLKPYKEKPIILVLSQGQQASVAAASVQAQGCARVLVLTGGMSEWTNSGLPVVKGK